MDWLAPRLAENTSAAIAVTLYPVLREHAAGMALGAVAFRLIEGVFYALSAAGTMILVGLSGAQPDGKDEGAGAADGARAASSLTPHHESQSTAQRQIRPPTDHGAIQHKDQPVRHGNGWPS